MEIKAKNIRDFVQKIGLPRLVLFVLAGVVLLVLSLPSGSGETESQTGDGSGSAAHQDVLQAMETYVKEQEKETEEILSRVEGIGAVEVMVTLAASEEKIPLQDQDVTDDNTSEQNQTGSGRTQSSYQSRKENVLVSGSEGEGPYVVQVNSPTIEGIVVVAEGAGSGRVKKEIIEAIQALFPIASHKIKVMKMK